MHATPREAYDRLRRSLGSQSWWPAETPFEVVVGAMLMPQTSWRNVERAIANLRRAGRLTPGEIARMDLRTLTALVRPAGLHASKPRRLRALCRSLVRDYGGSVDRLLAGPTEEVRARLLAFDGVGPEIADSILLYAGDHAVFVPDAYARRIGRRVGFLRADSYRAAQRRFESALPRDLGLYREYHALLVALAKEVCRPIPRCAACPLNDACSYGRRETHKAGKG